MAAPLPGYSRAIAGLSPLFHVGQAYTDTANNVTIRYVSHDDGSDAYHLFIDRGVVRADPTSCSLPGSAPR